MLAAAAGMAAFCASAALAALPPVPVPAENPITEPKRVLGKILFWDEQMSSDNTVACGTCHRPGKGGGDPRQGRFPGADGVMGTDDDTFGSPGVAHLDKAGIAREHKIFGMKPQVGDRTAPSNFGNIWSDYMFWDGRAGPKVVDPETGKTVIKTGGALENQALGPLQNPAEMAKDTRGWADVDEKLRYARPLALASHIPQDMAAAIKVHPRYPDLFKAAFGDPKIDAVRVAEAIATYERTLVPDQTPYDLGTKDGQPVDPAIRQGMLWLDTAHCTVCHKPPLFTDNKFHNIGVRRPFQDKGRGKISGDAADSGRFKTPTLRNVGLRASFMHTGEFTDLHKVLDHYVTPKADADPLPGTDQPYKTPIEDSQRQQIIDFLVNDLTDPRVAAEQFPFDRPILRSERQAGQGTPARPEAFKARFDGGVVKLTWSAPKGGAEDYVLTRDGKVIGLPTQTRFEDAGQSPWMRHSYRLVARNDAAASSRPVSTGAGVPSLQLAGGAVILLGFGGFWLWRRKKAA
jgi:LPXTG-motif cell wall-anchored protein